MIRHLIFSVAIAFTMAKAAAQETLGEPMPLIPESPLPANKPKPQPVVPKKKSSTEQAADDLQTRLRYRDAKTKALQDPRLQQEWERAHATKTEPARREAMKSYYTMFCDRMIRIDPGVKTQVEALRKSLAWRFTSTITTATKPVKPVGELDDANPDVTDN